MKTRLLLLACVCVWGWTFVATRICLEVLRPIDVVGLRFAIGLPILAAAVRLKRIPLRFTRPETVRLGAGAAVLAAHFLIQAVALRLTSATHTGWIIAITPLVIAVASFVFLREPIGRMEVVGIALATAGVLLLVSGGLPARLGWLRNWGDALVFLSAHTWALYTLVTRDVSRVRHPLAVTLVVLTPLTVVSIPAAALGSHLELRSLLAPRPLLALLFLGILGTAAQWGWQEGVARLGAARSGVYLYLEPVATTVLAVPLLGEGYGAATAIGGLMILGGVWWAEKGGSAGFRALPARFRSR